MRAVFIDNYGGAGELKVGQLANPEPKKNEVLIKVHYAGVNPVDYKIREGYLAKMLPSHFPIIPGWDASGEVISSGPGASKFKPGSKVFTYARKPSIQWGTYAELLAVNEDDIALVPEALSLADAGGVPLVALTAWQAIFDFGGLKAGQTILVHAGAGGVGGFVIQFARWIGAKVITTASQQKHDYVTELGADVAVDYRSADLKAEVEKFSPGGLDLVFDGVGGETLLKSYDLVKKGGKLVSIVDHPDADKGKALGIEVANVFVAPNGDQLEKIATLIAKGIVRPLKTKVMKLEEAKQAQEQSESRRTTGKIVLEIA